MSVDRKRPKGYRKAWNGGSPEEAMRLAARADVLDAARNLTLLCYEASDKAPFLLHKHPDAAKLDAALWELEKAVRGAPTRAAEGVREALVTVGKQLRAIEREGWMGDSQRGLLSSMILAVDTALAAGPSPTEDA